MDFTDAKGLRGFVPHAKRNVEFGIRILMEWLWVILAVFLAVDAVMLYRTSFIPAEEARRLLAGGAMIIDVRTEREFKTGHLPQALNIPLGELREQIALQAPDKNRTLLVHCQSGGRSEIARRRLRKMGYVTVYNLGSLGRAQQIVSSFTD